MDVAECPVFRPSMAEMRRSFESYIEQAGPACIGFGICKITAPAGWTPRAGGYNGVDFDSDISRIEQNFTRDRMAAGAYNATMLSLRKQTVRAFQQAAEVPSEKRLRAPEAQLNNLAGLESAYWRTIPGKTEYGADNEGSPSRCVQKCLKRLCMLSNSSASPAI